MIAFACYRTSTENDNWKTKDADTLATEIQQAVALTPLTWYQFRAQSIANGADAAQVATLYDTGGFFDLLVDALAVGDWAAIQDLKADVANLPNVTLSTATKQALNQTLIDNQISVIEQVASEQGQATPAVDAAAVTAALNAAGFTWSGTDWS